MYKLCRTEQSSQRQRQLEEGLLQAMQTRPYEEITVSDLCAAMNIPRKAFYRYFSGKDGALHALVDHTLMEYEGFIRPFFTASGHRTLHHDMEHFFLFWKQKEKLLAALTRSGLAGELIQRSVNYAMSDFAFPGRFLPNEDRDTQRHVVSFAVCGLLSMTLQWYTGGFREGVSRMASVAVRLLSRPLFPAAGSLLGL